jgi:cell division protein FtsB
MAKKREMSTTAMTSPAEAVEPWVIEQLSKRPKETWVRDQLQSFYNKEILDLKLESIKKELDSRLHSLEAGADDTQRVVIEQRGKWSLIPKRFEMEELKEAVTGWSSWFRRSLLGVILFLIGTGGMAVWKYAELNVHVGVVEREMEKVAKRNERLEIDVDQLEKKLEMLQAFLQAPKPVYKSQDKSPTGE